jgi:RimJ/RimL family protein N-acetyltransferase
MMNAARYEAIEILKSGAAVKVRSVRPDDKKRFSEAFRNLEAGSIRTRFFHHKKALTDQDLKAATEVDFEKDVALVATTEKGGTEIIVAGARYSVLDAAAAERGAEVAFTVEEDYQGQGLAGALLRHLIIIARGKGLSRFEAEVLPENKAMLNVFARSGLPMKQSVSDGTAHISLSLNKTE